MHQAKNDKAANGPTTGPLILPLSSINKSMHSMVGGKAANLGEMIHAANAHDINVPPGFCVTREGYKEFMSTSQKFCADTVGTSMEGLFRSLDQVDPNNTDAVRDVGEKVRRRLHEVPIPEEVANAIITAWGELSHRKDNFGNLSTDQEEEYLSNKSELKSGEISVAVRSSATAEDLPSASFAGQQDTYLNVVGIESVLQHVKLCWISLFTDRAIAYRAMNGFDHVNVHLCVVVQKQIDPLSSGVLFTADPLNGRRDITAIEATWGLGEALVSGLVNTDSYRVERQTGDMVEKTIGDKKIQIIAKVNEGKCGGTETVNLDEKMRTAQVLPEKQIADLLELGCKVQRHYCGIPQDIEWCIERGTNSLYLVQSRPITTLYPLPKIHPNVDKDDCLRAYISFGHIQMMTNPVPPLTCSMWRRILPILRDERNKSMVISEAGARIYMDVTDFLRLNRFVAKTYVTVLSFIDERMGASLASVAERRELQSGSSRVGYSRMIMCFIWFWRTIVLRVIWYLFFDQKLEKQAASSLSFLDFNADAIQRQLADEQDPFRRVHVCADAISSVLERLIPVFFPKIMAGLLSFIILRKLARDDETRLDDVERISKGLSGNVTTDMDLAIGDLADVARAEPAACDFLKVVGKDYNKLEKIPGAPEFSSALDLFLQRYGCRGASEIDISKARWDDDPTPILQVIRGNLAREEIGFHRAHHRQLMKEGEEAAKRLAFSCPPWQRPMVRRLTSVARSLLALREHHKFHLIQVISKLRREVINVSKILVKTSHFSSEDDVWFLTLDELLSVRDWSAEKIQSIIKARREEFNLNTKLKPPRILTNRGECIDVRPNNGFVPPGALAGISASPGVVEGIAKVILDPRNAVLNAGEILVAPFTDPGWTPLFINALGLVMEIGGLMTHGSVVAREYGIPAVICVDDATIKIKSGMRLRVHGSNGYVEILSDD